jgi:hypothetical protein
MSNSTMVISDLDRELLPEQARVGYAEEDVEDDHSPIR